MFLINHKSHQNSLLKLLKVNRTVFILVTSFKYLVKTLAIDLVNSIVTKQCLQLISLNCSIAIFVEQLEHFLEIVNLE